MFVCRLAPIDHWSGWQRPEDVFKIRVDDEERHTAEHWASLWQEARRLAEMLGWEGDIRQGPYVTVLPVVDGWVSPVIVAWKQDNNGTTFVASPYELSWLDAKEEDIALS